MLKKLFSIILCLFITAPVYGANFTDNYNLEIPDFATMDWGATISGDFISIDSAIKILSEDSGNVIELVFNVKHPDYGAVGDGVTDDTTAINAAITAANTAGGGTVFFPEGTYLVSTSVIGKSKVNLVGVGARKSIIDGTTCAAADIIIDMAGTIGTEITITVDASKGDSSVTVAAGDEAGFSAGDLVNIRSQLAFGAGGANYGELQLVSSTSSGTINVNELLFDDYAVTDTAGIRKLTPLEDVTISGLGILGEDGDNHYGIKAIYGYNLNIRDVEVIECDTEGITIYDILYGKVERCIVRGSDRTGNGYGIAPGGSSRNIVIDSNHTSLGRMGYDILGTGSGLARYITFVNNTSTNNTHGGFNSHEFYDPATVTWENCKSIVDDTTSNGWAFQSYGGTYTDCTVIGDGSSKPDGGFAIYRDNVTITGSYVEGVQWHAVNSPLATTAQKNNINITNNKFVNCRKGVFSYSPQFWKVQNNIFEDMLLEAVHFPYGDRPMTNNVITGNNFMCCDVVAISVDAQFDYSIIADNNTLSSDDIYIAPGAMTHGTVVNNGRVSWRTGNLYISGDIAIASFDPTYFVPNNALSVEGIITCDSISMDDGMIVGTKSFYINGAGNVGLGSTSPRVVLDVIGGSSITGKVSIDSSVAISGDTSLYGGVSIDTQVGFAFTSPTLATGGEVGRLAIISADGTSVGYIKIYSPS